MKTLTCEAGSSGGAEIYYTLAGVREILDVSAPTLWRMRKRGLRTVQIGGIVRIRKSDLDQFLSEHEE